MGKQTADYRGETSSGLMRISKSTVSDNMGAIEAHRATIMRDGIKYRGDGERLSASPYGAEKKQRTEKWETAENDL